ncbi:hypothetical protein O3Q52_19305 [Streptomyces sp. ActVer]|uniref:hypothetical protein n=1 Tax=Streptomyces sp. ActVer TaxID=3014558 RepID=UPI0022B3B536|nr:hypothetical protein [Streptomyces sp. ActVer]MCZ4510298.1 hypothetical protein [Streptomyces sp. ActVer]
MMPYFSGRRPTENAAVSRTPDHPAPTAPVPELRHRLLVAVRVDDGHAARLLINHLARAVA